MLAPDALRALIEEYLSALSFASELQGQETSVRYALAGGKRVRGVICLATAEAAGTAVDSALPAAAALELVHAFSLVHDDLPALDNDAERRGRPSVWASFGEAVAVLAGDALLTYAFELMSSPRFIGAMRPETALAIIREIAHGAGDMGMVGGQVVDIESEGEDKEVDFATLEYIHIHKTGALIRAAVRVGALAAGATDSQFDALTRYGKDVGLAFQVADDILDITGTTEELGKDAGSDVARGKKTYPAFVGLEESRRRANELSESAVRALDIFGPSADPLREVARYIVTRTN